MRQGLEDPAFAASGGLVEGGADLVDVGSVDADGFVELFAGDVELFGPVGDVGCHFGVDLFGVVGTFDMWTFVAVMFGVVDDLGAGEDGILRIGDDFYGAVVFFVRHGVLSSFRCLLNG